MVTKFINHRYALTLKKSSSTRLRQCATSPRALGVKVRYLEAGWRDLPTIYNHWLNHLIKSQTGLEEEEVGEDDEA